MPDVPYSLDHFIIRSASHLGNAEDQLDLRLEQKLDSLGKEVHFAGEEEQRTCRAAVNVLS
jgi:hypothetical protein